MTRTPAPPPPEGPGLEPLVRNPNRRALVRALAYLLHEEEERAEERRRQREPGR